GTAEALNTGDEAVAVRRVLQEQTQRLGRRGRGRDRLVQQLEALDVALVLEDAGDVGLDPRRGHVDARVLGGYRIADPRQHICDGVCHTLSTLNLVSWSIGKLVNGNSTHQFTNSPIYQLLLVTPVTSPSSASLRKHRRHSANFRMYARGRPQRRQRLRSRTLNLGVFCSFAIFAVVAINPLALSPDP